MPIHRSSVELILQRAWARRGALAMALWPLSLLFGLLAAVRRTLYRTGLLRKVRLPIPVIIVGNVYVGGTGKTPLVIWLVQVLRQAGYTPGVVSRGYGTQHDTPRPVTFDSAPEVVGDEPVLIAQRAQVPVAIGRHRAAAAWLLLAAYPDTDVIISDDGLQHYALERDIEILLFDSRGAGNKWLLPAGPLREPLSRHRDFTVINADLNGADLPENMTQMQLVGNTAERLVDRSQQVALASFVADPEKPSARIVAAAGIGNPNRFFSMLRSAGLTFDEMPLPDHYGFEENIFAEVVADIILITEKDAVKCSRIDGLRNDPRLWVVPVTAQINGTLAEKIVEKLRGRSTA